MIFIITAILQLLWKCEALEESERLEKWIQLNSTWPPKWQPESAAFQEAMFRQEQEIMLLPSIDERFENFRYLVQQRLVRRFTSVGFEVLPIPPELFQKLSAAMNKALANWRLVALEEPLGAVNNLVPSKYILLDGLKKEIVRTLQPLMEAWSGMELQYSNVYGIRSYREGATLSMHVDRIKTHVISAIVHVGHEYTYANDSWPLEILDHNGQLHAVSLEPGEMIFYESAACLHGRRQQFHGHHYSSIFVHFQPRMKEGLWEYTSDDLTEHLPPFWAEGCIESQGSRFNVGSFTIPSMLTANAKDRILFGEVVEEGEIKKYYQEKKIYMYNDRRIIQQPGHIYLKPDLEQDPYYVALKTDYISQQSSSTVPSKEVLLETEVSLEG